MKKKDFCIYKITNIQNRKVYIGYAEDYRRRHTAHMSYCFNQNSDHYHLTIYKAIRKYGLHNFKWEILGYCKNKKEMKQAETICIAFFQSNNKIYGYNNTPGGDGGATRTGWKSSEETKRKISESSKGKIISQEQKIKIANTLRGRKESEETRARKRLNHGGGSKPKPVLNITTGIIYESASEAARIDNVSQGGISQVCNGSYKQAGGFKYKYIEVTK